VAKRPELLILDEPVASLDPLARREFIQTLMEIVAGGGVTVVMSSHLVADLERVCDYFIVLADSRVAYADNVEDMLASHRRLIGPRRDSSSLPRDLVVVEESHTDKQSNLVVHGDGPVLDPGWTVAPVTLDDIVLAYMKRARDNHATGGPHLKVAG
jgi:ABC-2 type transport system ATP-binding protein